MAILRIFLKKQMNWSTGRSFSSILLKANSNEEIKPLLMAFKKFILFIARAKSALLYYIVLDNLGMIVMKALGLLGKRWEQWNLSEVFSNDFAFLYPSFLGPFSSRSFWYIFGVPLFIFCIFAGLWTPWGQWLHLTHLCCCSSVCWGIYFN